MVGAPSQDQASSLAFFKHEHAGSEMEGCAESAPDSATLLENVNPRTYYVPTLEELYGSDVMLVDDSSLSFGEALPEESAVVDSRVAPVPLEVVQKLQEWSKSIVEARPVDSMPEIWWEDEDQVPSESPSEEEGYVPVEEKPFETLSTEVVDDVLLDYLEGQDSGDDVSASAKSCDKPAAVDVLMDKSNSLVIDPSLQKSVLGFGEIAYNDTCWEQGLDEESTLETYLDNFLSFTAPEYETIIGTVDELLLYDDISGDGGVLKRVLRVGVGDVVPYESEVRVRFIGYLENRSTPMDSNFDRFGFPFRLGEGRVLYGWDVAVSSMRVSEVAKFVLSSRYAYGRMGCPPFVPASFSLAFEIELVSFVEKPLIENMTLSELRQADVPLFLRVINAEKQMGNELYLRGRFRQALSHYDKVGLLFGFIVSTNLCCDL